MRISVLIVEDDVTFSLMLKTWLGKKGFHVVTAASVADAKKKLEGLHPFKLILSDLRFPDQDGIDFLRWSKEERKQVPVLMMTGYADIHTAVQAIKLGAADYISKPINPDELLKKIKELINESPEQLPSEEEGFEKNPLYIEGTSQAAVSMYEHVKLVAPTEMSVLITGSSGTGKEYVARRIHEQSNRANAPFIAVDCGAIPKELAASEFFGHIKGSFTGAIENKTGAFVMAQGGTIFLDEIGNLSYEVQVQLLRALQEIRPVGSNQEIAIDVRLVSATNENLRQSIEKGEFREDLYHRINEFSIRIPDLKERPEDLLIFANHFLDLANNELKKEIIGFDAETIRLFQSYTWPGNLRQMKNVIRYATLLAKGRYITRNELPEDILADADAEKNDRTSTPLKDESHEIAMIRKALQECNNNKTKAAQQLGIDRKTLYNKMKLYRMG